MIKVLFLVRPDLNKIKAGDTVQVKSLKAALERLGLDIDISCEQQPDLKKYDLVHSFNLLRIEVTGGQCRWVKEQGKPLILTPIYWNMEEYLKNQRPDQLTWWKQSQKERKEVLKLADLIVPNAEEEWQQLKRDFQLDLPYRIIYNGVDPIFFSQNDRFERVNIISVGRIHSRKNQLQLINALKGTGLPLLFVGDINDPNYYRHCLRAAEGEKITFLKGMAQSSLVKIYQQARVHVMVSWYDTPGLVNLEAGLAGCNLVITNRGTAREYFQDLALYCDPVNPKEIREKVLKAYQVPLNKSLARYIFNHFTWNKIAQKTVAIYTEFLSQFI